MKRISILMAAAALAASPAFAYAGELANIKVVTDAAPDYSDMESMVHSITSNWSTDQEKMFALFYWDHIARRQTAPMQLHGYEVTDPIRQYNDYGFTMCSTITGIKCSEWNYMGYPCRMWDISLHTVPDVWYAGAFHHYDNSLSDFYLLPDGKTIAAVTDVGATMAGPASDGKEVPGYVALYGAVFGTGPDGFLQGADTDRPLSQIVHDFTPNFLKYRYYYYNQDRGYRNILNLRDGEVYTRYYSRQDINSPNAVAVSEKDDKYKADPAFYVPNHNDDETKTFDPEVVNPRYHIRGNGERTWTPLLDAADLTSQAYTTDNIVSTGKSLQPAAAGKPAEVVFNVEGGNVITSMKIHALSALASADDSASIAISTDNGLHWKDVWKSGKAGENPADLKFIDEVNNFHSVLVKVALNAKSSPAAAQLASIKFDTITEINNHTQPTLHLGKNTVYVGNGEQTESITLWPDLENSQYKPYSVDEQNVKSDDPKGYLGHLYLAQTGEGYVTFKVDAPTDVTSITYGARMYNRARDSHIDFLHSFDGGKTWKQDYSLTDTKAPWDTIHYERVDDVPPGTRSVLFKYALNSPEGKDPSNCSIYAVNMEVDHKLVQPSTEPVEVTFNWQERQKDYTTVKRSHTQVVGKLPATYIVNVGGDDQPIVDSLTVNLKGSRPDVKPGYSDGKDVGGEKFVGQWATYGKNLAMNKPYTVSIPSDTNWDAGDPEGKKLTDGRVGSSFTGGNTMKEGALWGPGKNPEIIVDLGEPQKCAAFRIHTYGYPYYDGILGSNKDHVEVLVSDDGKQYTSVGSFDFNLHWKDIPVNYMYTDDETFCAHNYFFAPKAPVAARYIKYKVSDNQRYIGVTEVQALDSFDFKPFDLKLALPDPADNGKAPPKPDVSPDAKQWKPDELPTTIGKPYKNPG